MVFIASKLGSNINIKGNTINVNLIFILIGVLKNGWAVVKILYYGYYNKYYYFDNTCRVLYFKLSTEKKNSKNKKGNKNKDKKRKIRKSGNVKIITIKKKKTKKKIQWTEGSLTYLINNKDIIILITLLNINSKVLK